MLLVSQKNVDNYLRDDDWVLKFIENNPRSEHHLQTDNWLEKSPAKRYIFNIFYKDIIKKNASKKRIYDIGGGISSFTNSLMEFNDYTLIDILTHGGDGEIIKQNKHYLAEKDWHDFTFKPSDLIIANDLFPNVDQRLEDFLNKVLPTTKYLRISLTWFSELNFYKVKRVPSNEILFVKSWLTKDIKVLIKEYKTKIINYDSEVLDVLPTSAFKNNRNICCLEFKGGG